MYILYRYDTYTRCISPAQSPNHTSGAYERARADTDTAAGDVTAAVGIAPVAPSFHPPRPPSSVLHWTRLRSQSTFRVIPLIHTAVRNAAVVFRSYLHTRRLGGRIIHFITVNGCNSQSVIVNTVLFLFSFSFVSPTSSSLFVSECAATRARKRTENGTRQKNRVRHVTRARRTA